MILQLASVQEHVLPPRVSTRAELLRRSAEQAAALPIGSVRGTKGSGRKS
jgi:hypothetical protein